MPAVAAKAENGVVRLPVKLTLAEGWKINELAPMGYIIEAAGATGPVDRQRLGKFTRLKTPASTFTVDVPVTAASGVDKIKVALRYYYCQTGSRGVCKVGSVVWNVPLKLSADTPANSAALTHAIE